MKKFLSLVLVLTFMLTFFGCAEKSGKTSENLSIVPATAVKKVKLVKEIQDEEWVYNAAESDVFMVPQLNIHGTKAEEINQELMKEYGEINQKATASGYMSARFTYAKVGAVLSILFTKRLEGGRLEYSALNINLTNGKKATNDDIIGYFKITKKAYYNAVKEGLRIEYNTYAGDFMDSMTTRYNQKLKESLSESNIKNAVPFFKNDGLYFISHVSDFTDYPEQVMCACLALTLEQSNNGNIK